MKKRMIVILALAAVVFSLIAPPWKSTRINPRSGAAISTDAMGYYLVFSPPFKPMAYGGVSIDAQRLIMQLDAIAAAAAVALILIKEKQ